MKSERLRWVRPLGVLVVLAVLGPVASGAQGRVEWVARYDGPPSGNDSGIRVAVDNHNNVYVLASSWGGPKNGSDYATIKYDPFGNEVWASRYDAPGVRSDIPAGLAVDASGNVYVTGESMGGRRANRYYVATIKYNSSGEEVWVREYEPEGHGTEIKVVDLAVDHLGNVYVIGRILTDSTGTDFVTIKYSTSGEEAWVRMYNGPADGGDFPAALAVDAQGGVYVTGKSKCRKDFHDHSRDYLTVKYERNGHEAWVRRYHGPADDLETAADIAVDCHGYVYLTGSSTGIGGRWDYATIKYDSDGEEVWVSRYDGPRTQRDRAKALAVDDFGNVYVTGESQNRGTGLDVVTVAYSSEGEQMWVATYDGPASGDDWAIDVAADDSGNAYVTMKIWRTDTDTEYATVKYSSMGEQIWLSTYSGPGNRDDWPMAMCLDDCGSVYVTGSSEGPDRKHDCVTVKYAP